MLGAGDYGGVGLETELMRIDGIARIAMTAKIAKIAKIGNANSSPICRTNWYRTKKKPIGHLVWAATQEGPAAPIKKFASLSSILPKSASYYRASYYRARD
jgi:hypothetical protein